MENDKIHKDHEENMKYNRRIFYLNALNIAMSIGKTCYDIYLGKQSTANSDDKKIKIDGPNDLKLKNAAAAAA